MSLARIDNQSSHRIRKLPALPFLFYRRFCEQVPRPFPFVAWRGKDDGWRYLAVFDIAIDDPTTLLQGLVDERQLFFIFRHEIIGRIVLRYRHLCFLLETSYTIQQGQAGRGTLQRIGFRSLDVYLLHLFLIYVNLSPVGQFFATYHNPMLELFAGLAMSLLVIGLCLVISNIIRCSDFLAKYLFGKVILVEK